MRKILTAGLALGLGLAPGLLFASAGASAKGRTCSTCGPAATTRLYRTVHPLLYVTRHHDRSVYHYVTRLHYVVDVTRIQPIVRVNDVTRVHHVTVVRDAYAYPPQEAITLPYVPPTPAYASGCGCMD